MKVKLEEVCKRIYAGGDVPKEHFSSVKTDKYCVPVYANAEKDDGLYGFTDMAREYESCVTVSARGTIGFAVIRTEPFLPVVRLITIVPDSSRISIKYLYYALKNYKPKSSGTSIPQLTVPEIKGYSFNLNSLDEQLVVEKNLDKLSKLIMVRKEQLQKLDELIKARFVEMFEQGAYEKVEFGDICEFLRNGANIKQTKGAEGIPITRIETLANDVFNIDRLGYADVFDLGKYAGYRLKAGDILISHINSVAYLGRAVQYRGQLKNSPIIHGMNLLCARIKDSFDPTFVEFFFRTPSAKEYISTITKKAVNQASITTTDLRKMMVPAAPYAEQKQFAMFVEQVNKSKAVFKKALEEAQLLFDSLMQKCFG